MVAFGFHSNTFLFLVFAAVIVSNYWQLSKASTLINKKATDLFNTPGVFITISPEANYTDEGNKTKLFDRRIELNWYDFDPEQGDYIGLYDKDPSSSKIVTALEIFEVHESTGYFKTRVRYIRQNLTATSNKCLGYWIAYMRILPRNRTKVVKRECFMIYPTWMRDLKETIGDMPLTSIMIPGTHNAGSWTHYEGKPTDNVLTNYVICQEDSVYQQLIHGIRYLDIRVAHYPLTKEKFWVNHDAFKVRPLKEVISDVKTFVMETNEIVFLDFHRFPVGFNDNAHEELLKLIHNEIGIFLAPKNLMSHVTPNQLWQNNQTVIWGYAKESIASKHEYLWPNVEQAWGSTNDVSRLESYLNSTIPSMGCNGKFWSAMAELTPTTADIFLRYNFGIRGFAAELNSKISYWYHQKTWYSKSMIVSSDYYLGNDIIQISYEVNRNTAVCTKSSQANRNCKICIEMRDLDLICSPLGRSYRGPVGGLRVIHGTGTGLRTTKLCTSCDDDIYTLIDLR